MANALKQARKTRGRATEIGMPHLLVTHTVVLYRYLKEHGVTLSLKAHHQADVLAIAVPPPKAPAFIKDRNNQASLRRLNNPCPGWKWWKPAVLVTSPGIPKM